ncbi:MAG: succinate dehydrogenase assembly factor 2 [Microvirgula sp.]
MSRYDREARSKIRWHSRRGLLELDLILTRFLEREFDQLSDEQIDAYVRVLEHGENDFLDLVNGKFDLEDPACQAIVERLRHG